MSECAVMLSIRPKWCELIANGEKTVEVRKTRPKTDTPFKCYIYCTKPKKILRYVWTKEDYEGYGDLHDKMADDEKVFCKIPDGTSPFCSPPYSGKVIGEFVCDAIAPLTFDEKGEPVLHIIDTATGWATGMTVKEAKKYCGDTEKRGLWCWHISDLVIYDEPKPLKLFQIPTTYPARRMTPPQSWCYAEEIE